MIRRVARRMAIFDEVVLINDNQYDSLYFRVADVPNEFTSGKCMFRIHGNNELLQPNSQILIQILDVGGRPVYHHVNTFVDVAGRVVIGVYIYPETPVGIGKLQIMGIATTRPGGRPVPRNWRGKYNVRWERDISIVPSKKNITPIIFQTIPGVKTFEKQRRYLTQEYTAGTAATSSQGGPEITYTYGGFGLATITTPGANSFTADMEGGTIEIPNPDVALTTGMFLQAGTGTSYTGFISTVVNSSQIQVQPYILSIYTEFLGEDDGTGTQEVSTVNSTYPPSSFGPLTNYTMSWNQDAIYATGSNNYQSFASITLKNLQPMVGHVHTVKTWMKSAGFATYQLMNEEVLEERDLLINIDSELAYDRIGNFRNIEVIDQFWHSESVNQNIAFRNIHSDTEMISSMVITGSALLGPSSNYPDPPLDTDPYIKVYSKATDIEIYKDNEYNLEFRVAAEADPDPQTQVSSSYIDIYISGSGIPSTDGRQIGHKLVTLQTVNDPPANNNSFPGGYEMMAELLNNPSSGISNPANTMGGLANVAVQAESLNVAANFNENFAASIETHTYGQLDERLLQLSYTPPVDTNAHIVFAVTRGRWHLADIRLVGARDHGFTPNHTFFEVPISTPQQDDVLDFKFEFYNTNGEIANITMLTQSMDFTGSNTYINGSNNEISGSLFIGDGLMMVGFSPPPAQA